MRHPCDSECARANHCMHREVECPRCGAEVLRCEVDDWGYCTDCSADAEAEREREEEEAEEVEGYILQKILEAKVEAAKAAAKAKGGNA